MADNAQKTPIARSLNKVAQRRINNALQLAGKSLPAKVTALVGDTNAIVKVSFLVQSKIPLPQVTIPVAGWEYSRYPIRVNDIGLCVPADVLLGGVTGLGTGTPSLKIPPANLQGLVFLPIGNSNWTATDDPAKLVMYGQNGWVLRDTNSKVQIIGDATTGVITLKNEAGAQITLNDDGTITLNGIVWDTHRHGGVEPGGGDTTGPTS